MALDIERILFHGTDCIIKEPRIIRSGHGKDFGYGFYLTEIQRQAEDWAIKRAEKNRTYTPIVNVYILDYTKVVNELKSKYFMETDKEWLEFIANSRKGVENDYDYIEGPMSDDKLYRYIEDYLTGEMDYKEFMYRARFKFPTHQILLKNDALKCLKWYKSYEVDQ